MTPLFAFIFESPLAAALMAGGAVSIPVIIHLLNRRRYRVVTWAAMRFLLSAQKKNARRMRLEQLLLLLVRCLVIFLLLLAMVSVTPWAEAFWRWCSPEGGLARTTRGQRTHKIIVVDGSMSMALLARGEGEGGEGEAPGIDRKAGARSCFEKARALAERLVSEGAGTDGYSVVLMAAPPRTVVLEPSEDANKVVKQISGMRLTHGTADLAATLSTVEGMVRSSPAKFVNKEVYFLTDMQQATWVAPRPGLLSATLRKIQERASTIFVDVNGKNGISSVGNLAITNLELVNPIATTTRPTPIKATLVNYGDTRDRVSVRLSIGKAREKDKDPKAELLEKDEILIRERLRTGQPTPVVFNRYRFEEPGDYVVQVRVSHDDLTPDDIRTAVVTVKDTVPVLLVDGKAFESSKRRFHRASEFLRAALNPSSLNPDQTAKPPENVVARPSEPLSESAFDDETKGSLKGYDVVYLCDVKRFTPNQVRRLEGHVRRGGGVVFCLGSRVNLTNYNEMLYKSGAGLLPARLLGHQLSGDAYRYQLFIPPGADQQDPLTPFRDSAREQLLTPLFQEFIQTEVAQRGGVRRILSFLPMELPGQDNKKPAPPSGGPAMLEWNPPTSRQSQPSNGGVPLRDGHWPRTGGRLRGKVVLITTTVNGDWNNWAATPSFLPLMQELMHFAASGKRSALSLAACEPMELFLPELSGKAMANLTFPGGGTHQIPTQMLGDGSVVRWLNTDITGMYQITVGDDPQEYLFAVNPPLNTADQKSESNLERTDREELRTIYPEWEVQVVTDLGQVKHERRNTENTQIVLQPLGGEIAHWILLTVLVLVLLEVVLAWVFGHYTTAANLGESASKGRMSAWKWMTPLVLAGVLFLFSVGMGFVLLHDAMTGDFLGFLPEGTRSGVERLLGIPAPAAGEGSHWRLEYTPYFWDAQTDRWLVGGLVILAGAGICLLYHLEALATYQRQGGSNLLGGNILAAIGYRFVLLGLRMGLLLLLLVVLLPQLRLWFEREGWPDVVILIDDSQSMSEQDDFRDQEVKELAEQLASQVELTRADRLQLAQALLTRPDLQHQGCWLTELLTQRRVRLHVYRCARRAQRLADVYEAEDIDNALQEIKKLKASKDHDSSQLGVAVRQVLNDFRGASLAAVVMLTDGVTTEGEDLVKVSKYAVQMGVPLYFVGLGDAREMRNYYLHDLQVEESVYVNDRVVFEVKLTAQGYDPGKVTVTLHEKGKKEVLDSETVTVGGKKKGVKVTLLHQPSRPGKKVYELRVPEHKDEIIKDDNRLSREVFVRKAKKIKVLYVEGYRRYEYHYVKTLLERESDRLKGNKSIDLKVLLLDADAEFAAQDRSAISDWPNSKDLESFDVVIIGDVDPRPTRGNKMNEHLKDVANFVLERGGGLLMIAGERYAPRYYRNSPLKDILPIEITQDPMEQPQVGRVIASGYRPQLTPNGSLHPIFRFSRDEEENKKILGEFRPMFWYAEGYEPKPVAEVLAVHPGVQRADRGVGALAINQHPLVLQMFAPGRTMFLGFHETWRWGFREKQKHFNHFWIQIIRHLARSRLGRVDLRLDRQPARYRRGDPIKILVRFPDGEAAPKSSKVKVAWERKHPKNSNDVTHGTIELAKIKGSRGTYEALMTKTPEGKYTFRLTKPIRTPQPRTEAQVVAPPGEMEQLRMNRGDMERAAAESQGQFYTLPEAHRVLEELEIGTRVTINAPGPPWTLWNHFILFLVALLFVTSEWVIRKQLNLL